MEQQHGAYLVSDDPGRLDAAAVHAYLSRSYWSENIPLATVQLAWAPSVRAAPQHNFEQNDSILHRCPCFYTAGIALALLHAVGHMAPTCPAPAHRHRKRVQLEYGRASDKANT